MRTLDEAEARVKTIRAKFQGRSLHSEVLKYCRAELMQDNYFHAVFEAAKGLAQSVRDPGGFITSRTPTANQIEFIDLIVNHLTEHGVMDPARLYESPFTDITFTAEQVDDLVARLRHIRVTAVAA